MVCFDAQFVVAASDILDKRVTPDHDRSCAVGSQSAHWPQPGFEPAVIALHTVIRILLGVVKRVGNEFLDRVNGPNIRPSRILNGSSS